MSERRCGPVERGGIPAIVLFVGAPGIGDDVVAEREVDDRLPVGVDRCLRSAAVRAHRVELVAIGDHHIGTRCVPQSCPSRVAQRELTEPRKTLLDAVLGEQRIEDRIAESHNFPFGLECAQVF